MYDRILLWTYPQWCVYAQLCVTWCGSIIECHTRNGHTHLTHSYILKDPPPQCEHCQCILTVHHFLVEEEGNVLFNDALNTFYLRLYGVRHMVEDHSDSEKGNSLPPHTLLFPISTKEGFFYMHHLTDRITHTAFVTPVVEHWLEREIAQCVHLKDRSDDPSHHERTLLPRSYTSLPHFGGVQSFCSTKDINLVEEIWRNHFYSTSH